MGLGMLHLELCEFVEGLLEVGHPSASASEHGPWHASPRALRVRGGTFGSGSPVSLSASPTLPVLSWRGPQTLCKPPVACFQQWQHLCFLPWPCQGPCWLFHN